MTHTTESEGTYCSEVEKQDQNEICRSKRLSQRNLLSSFQSESLQLEVEYIRNAIKRKHKGSPYFISKKINKYLQKLSTICPNESTTTIQPDQNYEQVKSPNILAGLMTEVLTEIPPYQPENLPEIKGTVKNSEPTITLTQKNPLDLTRKNFVVQVMPNKVLSQEFLEREKQAKTKTPIKTFTFDQRDKVKASRKLKFSPVRSESNANKPFRNTENIRKRDANLNQFGNLGNISPCFLLDKIKAATATTTLNISKDSIIDLTEENVSETNGENIVPVMKGRTGRPKTPVHVSKWLQFLPTQQRPTKRAYVTTTTTTCKKKSKTLENSIVKLDRDQPTATTSISNSIQKPLTASYPRKSKHIRKLNFSPKRSESNANKPFRNTENIITRDANLTAEFPRHAQSEHSPGFLLDEVFGSDMNDKEESLPSSLKEGFRKGFGTDKLKDLFVDDEVVYCVEENHVVGDKVVYCLKENHVRCLARALKVEHGVLNETIENILSNDNCGLFLDDIMQSDSSVVECSQSPTKRIFPSQRFKK